MADDDKGGQKASHQMRVIIDPTGRKAVEKLFEAYIHRGRGNFSRLPEYMLAIDRLTSEFGGEPLPADDEDETNPEPGDDETDEDIHEAASEEVSSVRDAVARVLRETADIDANPAMRQWITVDGDTYRGMQDGRQTVIHGRRAVVLQKKPTPHPHGDGSGYQNSVTAAPKVLVRWLDPPAR